MKPLRKWRRGEAITARRLNQMQDGPLARLRPGPGIRLIRTGGNVVIANARRGGPAGLVWMGTVEELPDIPTSGGAECYWTSAGAGNGDDQIWRVHAGQTEWTATQFGTVLDGEPL